MSITAALVETGVAKFFLLFDEESFRIRGIRIQGFYRKSDTVK